MTDLDRLNAIAETINALRLDVLQMSPEVKQRQEYDQIKLRLSVVYALICDLETDPELQK